MQTGPSASPAEADFTSALIEAARTHKSWRERLQWVRDRLTDPAFTPVPGPLATVAIYLRLLATGELQCEEDGRHYRPNHHAEAAFRIEVALERLATPETAWILRRIYPFLPSWGEEFRRAEPLTHIRDIAHRNDIPPDLKKEIKHRLQNKLHRCAGPEDLRTSEEILCRITAPGAGFAPAFVQEFQTFHEELREFFNAMTLEKRLRAIGLAIDPATREVVNAFLALKGTASHSSDQLLTLLERLTELRLRFAEQINRQGPRLRSQLRLADIGLEDYAFALLSECTNRLADWPTLLRALVAALDNLRLSLVEPEECGALRSECSAWAKNFSSEDRFHLLRVLATLARARRLAESYTDRISRLFLPRVEELGRALGIMDHAIKVFTEGDIRGHLIFQLSRLVDLGLQRGRSALQLPPWEAIVPGTAVGTLVHAADLLQVERQKGPLVLLLERADGDAEIPAGVQGIALGHPMPHLSHLGVRARQGRIAFAATVDQKHLKDFESLVGKRVQLNVTPDGSSIQEATSQLDLSFRAGKTPPQRETINQDRDAESCGAKAAAAQRLVELADSSGHLFRAPRCLAIPFDVMERSLIQVPDIRREYLALQERLSGSSPEELEVSLRRLRELVHCLPVPEEVERSVMEFFGPNVRLAVRSSSNGEDLEDLSGAGLYESVVNVSATAVVGAIRQVWASLWTRRATLSRMQADIPHTQIRMAVLVQELVWPDLSFIMHTANPLTGDREEAMVELAVGLGETLASSRSPGTPYRLLCHRKTGAVRLHCCSTFSVALRPSLGPGAAIVQERLDYSRIALSADPDAGQRLGKRLAQIATFLEERLGRPQDVEGVCVGEEIHLVQARPQQGL
jgi:phosphoglucan,water dikinase